jgi:mannose-6-phosphate isomerase-like protein (cupin superfamily)
MKITRVESISVFQNPHEVEAKRIYENGKIGVIYMALKPGQSLKKHTTPVDVFFYILEGKGIVEIGEEKQEVEKDMLIESPTKKYKRASFQVSGCKTHIIRRK